jgi:hypothetical protein
LPDILPSYPNRSYCVTVLAAPSQIDRFRAVVVCSAMKMYLDHGIKVNRMYTPENMRNVASEYTGKVYARSRKGLVTAHADLAALLGK